MKKITGAPICFLLITLCGCTEIVNDYKLENFHDSVVPVCVNHPKKMKIISQELSKPDNCGRTKVIPKKYEAIHDECSELEPFVVPYSNCLTNLPLPIHLVEKKVGDMTICYDRNNKVELPILYCQKDMSVYVNTQVNQIVTQY